MYNPEQFKRIRLLKKLNLTEMIYMNRLNISCDERVV